MPGIKRHHWNSETNKNIDWDQVDQATYNISGPIKKNKKNSLLSDSKMPIG